MVLKKLIARSLPVSCLVAMVAGLAWAEDLPSLELSRPYPEALTPVSAILDNARLDEPLPLKPVEPEVTLELPAATKIGPQPPTPAEETSSQSTKTEPSTKAEPAPKPEAQPAASETAENPAQPQAADKPAEEGSEQETVERPAPAEAPDQSAVASGEESGKSKAKKHVKPISYSPVPAIAIFPVMKTGSEKAFSDLPVLFSREIAQGMENTAAGSKIYHPVYTVDELKLRGLGHIYDKVMRYYVQAGRPEPAAMDYMLKQLSSEDRPITRVVFVEADLDLNHAAEPAGVWDRVNAWVTDATPTHTKYHIRSRLQVFNTEDPEMHRTWSWSWNKSIKTDKFYNVTPSVFADSDSQQAFAAVSRQMTREIMLAMSRLGKTAYLDPLYDTSVTGQLAPKQNPFPNFTEAPAKNGITTTDREAIERILRRQNSIAP